MTREDIILMVQEAIIAFPNQNPFDFRLLQIETIERFAALVAAHEREACAKVAETHQYVAGWGVAAAIRAGGQENKS